MILKKLTLKNFKGLLAGAGIPEVVIDFDDLPAGLVAIVGGNGMGKTTILDNLHPYRLMPYKLRKAAGWSPGAFSFYDQCQGEARKELDFEMSGSLYRSVVLIDADRRKQEAYLYRMVDGQWVPLNDGKTRTYDEAVEQVCGSPSLFFTSVFRSQGAKNLSDYPRGDIVGIVSELLNIDHIREQGRKAKEVADSLFSSCSALREKAEALRLDLDGEPLALERKNDLERDLSVVKESLTAHDKETLTLEDKLRAAESLVISQEADRKKLEEKKRALADLLLQQDEAKAAVNRRANDLTVDIANLGESTAQTMRRLDAEKYRLSSDLRAVCGAAEKEIAAIDQKIARCEKIQEGASLIQEAVAKEADLQRAIASHKDRLQNARVYLEDWRKEIQRTINLKNKFESDLRHLDVLQKQAAGMSTLDCRADGSGWVNEACPLLSGAVKARDEAAILSREVESLRLAIKPLLPGLEERRDERAATVVSEIEKEISAAEADLKEAQKFTKLLPELEQAVALLDDLRDQRGKVLSRLEEDKARIQKNIDDVSSAIFDETEAVKEKLKNLEARRAEARAEGDKIAAGFRSRIETAENEIKALSLSLLDDAAAKRDALLSLLSGHKLRRPSLEVEINNLSRQLGSVSAAIEAFAKKRNDLEGIGLEISGIDANVADWRLLQKACSNDGIISLEIDDAGPSISAIANDLLKSCYGPRFSVRIETQAEKVNGGAKETFDITVFDAETNESKSITEMSGGQVCWIEDALTRAICLFNINRSDRVFGTLFSDEKDGALDADRKQEFMAVKRRSLELGTHGREIFITQTPELLDLADGVIRLSAGKVEVG